jgi:hypothetical protein
MEKGIKNLQHFARLAEKRQRDGGMGLPSDVNTTYVGVPPPPSSSETMPSSSSIPPSARTRPPRNSLGSCDSGIDLSNNEMDCSDEMSPGSSMRSNVISSASLPSSSSNYSSSSRRASMFPPLPPGHSGFQQTPAQSPELVQRTKAGSVGSAPAMWSGLPPSTNTGAPMPMQHQDSMALHRGSLPSIHSMLSSRQGPAFTRA